MKKTYTINISGTVFHIEDEAYEKLNQYISNLKQHFGNDEEGHEIVTDIESRIAEIFNDKKTNDKEVITLKWVDEVIEAMGVPEDFIENDSEEDSFSSKKHKKRLYRDPDEKVLGGVCGGLAAYFTTDPVIIRIIFALLLFANGFGLLVYIILWIAVPEARTTSQRLEMRGKAVNIENIEKWIKKEFKEFEKQVKNIRWKKKATTK